MAPPVALRPSSMLRFAVAAAFAFGADAPNVGACSVCECGDDSICSPCVDCGERPAATIAFEILLLQRSFALDESELPTAAPSPIRGGSIAFHGSHTVGDSSATPTRSESRFIQQFVARVPLSTRLLASATVPYVVRRVTEPGLEESTQGFGDPEAGVEWRFASFADSSGSLTLVGGVRLPLGETRARDRSGALLTAHDQLGLGSSGGSLGLVAWLSRGRRTLAASASGSVNGTSDNEFHAGNAFRYNIAALQSLGSRWEGRVELNGRYAFEDRLDGAQDPDSGGTLVVVSPGIRASLGAGLSLQVQVQVPIVEVLHGNQDEGVNARSGIVWTLE